MKKLMTAAAVAALMGVTSSASAWWGWGPGWWDRGWGDDWWGDGFFDFNMSAGAHGRGWGRGYDYYGPWWGPYAYPYYGWGYPYAYPYAVAPVAPKTPSSSESK